MRMFAVCVEAQVIATSTHAKSPLAATSEHSAQDDV
jgi:hypothetical protein